MTTRGRRWAAVYLGVVAATVLFVLATFTLIESRDSGANLAPVWLFIVTLPWSLLLTAGTGPGRTVPWFLLAGGLVIAAAMNAALLGWAGDRSTDRR